MKSVHLFWRRARLPLAVCLASTLADPAFGLSFNIGEVEGQFDSSLSYSTSWSTQNPDKSLIGVNNGGHGLSQATDNGRLNFKAGQVFSQLFKGVHDVELKYNDYGLFVRGQYWYDFKLQDGDLDFKNVSNAGRKEEAKSSGGEILDAFVYHNYTIGDLPGTVRVGKQVVNWGEGTFIGNGINSINPVDVSAFRSPGTEIKDGLIPVNLFYLSQNITDNLSADGFYQLDWRQTVQDNCGTFFSQSDVLADGCSNNLAVLQTQAGQASGLSAAQRSAVNGVLAARGVTYGSPDEGVIVPRGPDRDARDSGQFGLAIHYMVDPLNTEFGAYYMNYHSRLPIVSARTATAASYNTGALAGQLQAAGISASQAGSLASSLESSVVAGNSSYFAEYPEDIHLYGLSFSTTLPSGTLWSGEISYRPNAPIQINTTDVLNATLAPLSSGSSLLGSSADSDVQGYRRKEITQAQTTFKRYFDQVMGADRFTTVAEIGWTHVGGLDSTSKVRYGRDASYGSGPSANGTCLSASRYCENDGFTTANSWGYRARAIWDYNNVFSGVNLKPSVAWSHDVKGYSPNPGGEFEEGRKAISLGLNADYENTYTAGLSYTNFFDGKYSTVDDRDFVTLSVGMAF